MKKKILKKVEKNDAKSDGQIDLEEISDNMSQKS